MHRCFDELAKRRSSSQLHGINNTTSDKDYEWMSMTASLKVKLLADVEVKRSGILMRATTITGKRNEVLTAGRVFLRSIGERISKI